MITRKQQIGVFLLAAITIAVAGCLVSGTFVLDFSVSESDFQQRGNSYYTLVDLTENQIWKDHQDNLDRVDMVGFELWITNVGTASSFEMFIDHTSEPVWFTVQGIDSFAIPVLTNLTVPVGVKHVTYGESFTYLVNLDSLTTIAKTGQFHFYATWTEATDLVIDSARVVVTISASDT